MISKSTMKNQTKQCYYTYHITDNCTSNFAPNMSYLTMQVNIPLLIFT